MSVNESGSGARRRRSSNKGVAYGYVRNGTEILAKWPKGRGRNLPEKTRAQMEYFRQIQWAFKFSAALVQQSYYEAVARTPLMPRDLFLSAASGRLHFLVTPDGRRWVSTAAQKSVSDSIDILAQLEGQLLCRGPEIWQPIEGGTAGQILTSVGPTVPPVWSDAPAPPAGAAWGTITGDLADQLDLQAALNALAGQAVWGSITGDVHDQADLQAWQDAQDADIATRASLGGDNTFTGTNDFTGDTSFQGAIEFVGIPQTGPDSGNVQSFEVGGSRPLVSDFTMLNGNANDQLLQTTFGAAVVKPATGAGGITAAVWNATPDPVTFTVTARLSGIIPRNPPGYVSVIILRNSTNGRVIVWGDYQNMTQILGQNWSSMVAFNSNWSAPVAYNCAANPWRRVIRDHNNLTFQYSPDGDVWGTYQTITASGFVEGGGGGVLDQVGFATFGEGATVCTSFTLVTAIPAGYVPTTWGELVARVP